MMSTEDRWSPAAAPDPTRDRHSAWSDAPAAGRPHRLPVAAPPPRTYLGFAVVSVFCFLPFGVAAVVKSVSASRLWQRGLDDEARRASRAARNWALAAVLCTPVQVAFVTMVVALGFLAAAFS